MYVRRSIRMRAFSQTEKFVRMCGCMGVGGCGWVGGWVRVEILAQKERREGPGWRHSWVGGRERSLHVREESGAATQSEVFVRMCVCTCVPQL